MDEVNSEEAERLEEFARRLEAARPALSRPALARIERTMQREIRHVALQRRLWTFFSAASLAAAVLVAIGFFVTSFHGRPQPHTVAVGPPAAAPAVEDRFRVALTPPGAPAEPARPLLPLEEYRSLIEDVN